MEEELRINELFHSSCGQMKERLKDAEDPEFIQRILRKELDDNRLVVENISVDFGSEKGQNFLSTLKRVSVTGKYGADNKDFHRSLIVKRTLASSDSKEDVFHSQEAFLNEVQAYSTIVPTFQTISLNLDLPYPKCLFSGEDDQGNLIIMLEDLKEGGYMTPKCSLTFKECDLVIQKFAHLHATSMVLRIVNRKEFDKCLAVINDYMFVPGRETVFPSVFQHNVILVLRSLRDHNEDGRLTNSIKFIEKHFTNQRLYEIVQRIVKREKDEKLLAICHGDSWRNNVMLKGSLDARLIDLQIMRYASPTIDLLHFLYSSMDSTQYYPQLIANYQAALMKRIDLIAKPYLNVEGTRDEIEQLKSLHTTELILQRMRQNAIYGLGILLIMLPVITTGEGHAGDALNSKPSVVCSGSQYCTRLRGAVLEFEASGLFQEEFV